MEWKHERRLLFVMSERWSGWLCERCCWNRPLPADEEEKQRVARAVQEEYRKHECEEFREKNWKAGD